MLGRLRRARRVLEEAEGRLRAVPPRASPPLARHAFLLLLDPESGKTAPHADLVVSGAVVAELVREGRVGVAGTGKRTSLTVSDPTPLGDELLDDALLTLRSGLYGQRATRFLGLLYSEYYVRKALLAEGALIEEERRLLGVLTVRRLRPTPAAGRDPLAAAVRSALLGEAVPDARTALLVSVITTGVSLRRFVPKDRRREAERRAREIRQQLPDDERAVVSAVQEAVIRASGD